MITIKVVRFGMTPVLMNIPEGTELREIYEDIKKVASVYLEDEWISLSVNGNQVGHRSSRVLKDGDSILISELVVSDPLDIVPEQWRTFALAIANIPHVRIEWHSTDTPYFWGMTVHHTKGACLRRVTFHPHYIGTKMIDVTKEGVEWTPDFSEDTK